jgi:glyceraldehyde-3-phosphate dehydrogenase/erythrose-4-phosphate dehydrogenase
MIITVTINGYSRIGRNVLRADLNVQEDNAGNITDDIRIRAAFIAVLHPRTSS